MVGGERARLRESFQVVMEQRASEVTSGIQQSIGKMERELQRALTTDRLDAETLREIPRRERLVQEIFLIDPQGKRLHPSVVAGLQSNDEVAFLSRSEAFWKSGDRLNATTDDAGNAPTQGWHVWYHGAGPRYLFWKALPGGQLLGAEVPPASLMAEIIASLPANHDEESAFDLIDSRGRSIYQWGQVSTGGITVKQPLPAPLNGWLLHCTMPDPVAKGAGQWQTNLFLGLGAAGLVLGLIAFHLYRESARESRLAGQRVSFVNQVSHELKTPLTNISLYAELASQQLPEDATHAQECLEIVTSESARLGRLIGNVLTFSKHQRGNLQPRLAECDLAAATRAIVEQFRPALEAKLIKLNLSIPTLVPIRTDADMLGQILGNLLSNVEKYAATGEKLDITVEQSEKATKFTVRDYGPGIPASMHERIFEPFFRVSDKLSDGSTGTGIGLGIARDLARLLGGELKSQSPATGTGAQFILTIHHA